MINLIGFEPGAGSVKLAIGIKLAVAVKLAIALPGEGGVTYIHLATHRLLLSVIAYSRDYGRCTTCK